MFFSNFPCSSCLAVMAFNLLPSILCFVLKGSLLLAATAFGHSCGLSLVVSIIGLF